MTVRSPYVDDAEADGVDAVAASSREREAADWRQLMSTDVGRRVAHRIIAMARLGDSTFHQNQAQMCLYEGRRTIGLELLGTLRKHCLEQVRLMETENHTWHKK